MRGKAEVRGYSPTSARFHRETRATPCASGFENNGTGMPESVVRKIFDPFFTTKSGTQGTGLGLSISHEIVREHEGQLAVDTREGRVHGVRHRPAAGEGQVAFRRRDRRSLLVARVDATPHTADRSPGFRYWMSLRDVRRTHALASRTGRRWCGPRAESGDSRARRRPRARTAVRSSRRPSRPGMHQRRHPLRSEPAVARSVSVMALSAAAGGCGRARPGRHAPHGSTSPFRAPRVRRPARPARARGGRPGPATAPKPGFGTGGSWARCRSSVPIHHRGARTDRGSSRRPG